MDYRKALYHKQPNHADSTHATSTSTTICTHNYLSFSTHPHSTPSIYGFSFAHFSPFWMLPFRSFKHVSSRPCSCGVTLPTGWISSTPLGPSVTLEAK